MPKERSRKTEADDLRRRSEARLSARKAKPAAGEVADPPRVLHELEVHRVELEIQNEELRATRKELEEALLRYRELFHFAPIGYLVLSPDGLIRDSNLAVARLLELESARLVGKHLAQFIAAADLPRFSAFLAEVRNASADSATPRCELSLQGPKGALVRLSGALLHDSFEQLLVGFEDLTAQKAAEASLRLESSRKDEFVAMLSHELRNPLAAMRSAVYVLTRTEPGSEPAKKSEQVLNRQVGHLTRMVDDLLDVTRIMRGKLSLTREPLELGELVRHTLADNRAVFEAAGVDVSSRLPPDFVWVDADSTRIVQALGNLLTNAVKFTPRGGRVVVSLQKEGTAASLSVRDFGVGIAPGAKASLFEPFWQGPQSLDRPRGGLGLGLALVKGLMELHGGTVAVESAGEGTGSTFTLRLPLSEIPRRPGTSPSRRYRILVIEDNEDSADSLRDALALDGHEVEVAYDGETGLERVRATQPDVVLCDLGLPKMNGFDVARSVRGEVAIKGLSLVALSGYASPDDRERALEAGFDVHVSKPATVEKLKDLLKSLHPS